MKQSNFKSTFLQINGEKYEVTIKELPTFSNGLCYVIESKVYSDDPSKEFWITVERIKGVIFSDH